jgi:hypothetical protein
MQRVWKELRKPTRRVNHDNIWRGCLRVFAKRADPPLDDRGIASEVFLATAVFLTVMGDCIEDLISTEAELRERTESFRRERDQRIANLRAAAADLRHETVAERFGDFLTRKHAHRALLEQHAQAMESVAEFLEQDRLPEATSVIAHDRGDRRVRAFVILLARETKALFGEVLLATVATTVNVALGLTGERKVSHEQVRNWTRPPRPRAT